MSFLTELVELLESVNTTSSAVKTFNYCSERYKSIYHELLKIGFNKVHSMNDTIDEIILYTMLVFVDEYIYIILPTYKQLEMQVNENTF